MAPSAMMRVGTLGLLVLAMGCVEAAQAQPVPRANPDPNAAARRRREAQVAASRRAVLRILSRDQGDAGAALLGGLLGASVGDSFGTGGLGGLGAPRGDGGTIGLGGLGMIGRGGGPGTGAGVGYGMGGLGRRGPPTAARFEEVVVRGPVPRWQVLSELSQQQARVHNCLVTAGRLTPVDLPVRFRLRGANGVEGIEVEGATPAVDRCVREHLSQGLFGPSEPATEVTARLRVGARPAP